MALRRRGSSGGSSAGAAEPVRAGGRGDGVAPTVTNGDGGPAPGGEDGNGGAARAEAAAPKAVSALASGTSSPALPYKSTSSPPMGTSRPLFTEARQPRSLKRDGSRFVPNQDEEKPPPKRYATARDAWPASAPAPPPAPPPDRRVSLRCAKAPGAGAAAEKDEAAD